MQDMVNCLLEAGATPDATDEQGRTPAKVAAAAGHRGIVAALLGRTGAGAGAGAAAGLRGGKGGGGAAGVSSEEVEELMQAVQREKAEVRRGGGCGEQKREGESGRKGRMCAALMLSC